MAKDEKKNDDRWDRFFTKEEDDGSKTDHHIWGDRSKPDTANERNHGHTVTKRNDDEKYSTVEYVRTEKGDVQVRDNKPTK